MTMPRWKDDVEGEGRCRGGMTMPRWKEDAEMERGRGKKVFFPKQRSIEELESS